MPKTKVTIIAALVATGALLTFAYLLYNNWDGEAGLKYNDVFDDPEDELERKELVDRQAKDKSQTGMLSGFATDRMDDDAAVNVQKKFPHQKDWVESVPSPK